MRGNSDSHKYFVSFPYAKQVYLSSQSYCTNPQETDALVMLDMHAFKFTWLCFFHVRTKKSYISYKCV